MIEQKLMLVKELLRKVHEGADLEALKREYSHVLSQVSPFEIPLIEQQLVREGVPIREVLKLCDLHVALFREYLVQRELKGVPEGHPLDLLLRENELILKWAEQLGVVASALLRAEDSEAEQLFETLKQLLSELRGVRVHYRKVQMLIFPYLERRGIVAVPRVLWGREDRVITKLRALLKQVSEQLSPAARREIASGSLALAGEVQELVFRENKILYPAVWALFSAGEWAAIAEEAEAIGYLVEVNKKWVPSAEPLLPYEVEPSITPEAVEKLPPEFREAAMVRLEADTYELRREGDIDIGTGFISPKEVQAILNALPIEITFADAEDRVRFYSNGRLPPAFTRTRTILGRRLLFCHPPRLETAVENAVEALKKGEPYREFWTRIGDRIVRVFVSAVRDEAGNYLGAVEVVEDFTEILKNPEEVLKKVAVL